MSATQAIGAGNNGTRDPREAIARAAAASGVDFRYLLAQAKLESGLDPSARAATSSAAGLYQFTRSTWLETVDRHGAEHGLGWAMQAIDRGQVRDPAVRAQLLALRFDPDLSARMAAELAGDHREALRTVIGREPDATELYLAHFLGGAGAGRFLTALNADPGQSAAGLLPQAAMANRAIFFEPSGEARSLGQVLGLLREKLEAAMGADDISAAPLSSFETSDWGWTSGAMSRGRAERGSQPEPTRVGLSPSRPSMADTLAATFGISPDAPPHVRAAQARLRAFGL